jgi:hypothetical protein
MPMNIVNSKEKKEKKGYVVCKWSKDELGNGVVMRRGSLLRPLTPFYKAEPEFVNVEGARESIPPASVG